MQGEAPGAGSRRWAVGAIAAGMVSESSGRVGRKSFPDPFSVVNSLETLQVPQIQEPTHRHKYHGRSLSQIEGVR